jgi:general secretion pathway protein A
MYLAHYGLNKKPFDISPDPTFLWLGEKHREGLSILKYGLLENKGFLLITGDVGTGKTALIRAIEKEVQARAIVVTIPDPGMSLMDFFNFMAAELKMDRSFQNKGDFLIHFKRLILEAFSSLRRVLLIIDESQRLNHELLEEIRLLSNIDLAGKVLINIFFVGQTEFRQILARQENRAIRQRITVSYHISPLAEEEVQQYITHRLKVAGATRDIFSPEAIRAVHRYSSGYPRLINIICDHALMSGYANGIDRIGEEIIAECRDELKIAFGGGLVEEKPLPQTRESRDRKPGRPLPPEDRPTWAGRSTLIFAVCLVLFGAGWYFFRDRISDELARWGTAHELREPRAQAGSEGDDSLRRVPPLPLEAGSREQKAERPSEPAPAGEAPPSPARPSAAGPPPQTDTPQQQAPLAAAPKTEPAPAPSTPPALPPSKSAAPDIGVPAAAPPEPFSLKDFTVYFTQNSTEIPVYALDVLSAAVALLKSNPETRGRIEGHSDSIGEPSYNVLVSENRAASVKNHMVRQGVEASRLTISGFGSRKPLEGNDTPEGRSRNRRVVIRIVSGQPG